MAVFVALFAVALAPPPHDYAHLEAVLQAKDEQIAALTSQLAWRGPEKKPAEPVAQVALGAKPAAPRAELAGAPQVGLDHYISAANFKVEVDGLEIENSKIVGVSGIVSESEGQGHTWCTATMPHRAPSPWCTAESMRHVWHTRQART